MKQEKGNKTCVCVCLSFYGFMADEGGNRKKGGLREEVCVSGVTKNCEEC